MYRDVMTLGVLITLDDLLFGDLGEGLSVAHAFDITDRLTRWGMDHAKGDPALGRGRM
jgi:hypothetical protein